MDETTNVRGANVKRERRRETRIYISDFSELFIAFHYVIPLGTYYCDRTRRSPSLLPSPNPAPRTSPHPLGFRRDDVLLPVYNGISVIFFFLITLSHLCARMSQ